MSAVLLVGVLGGCTSVKMVQRDGCWVRRTEKRALGTVTEEVGPCARPAVAFVENDPLTRMVQECIARADYRWQARALAAWDRREPWPEQLSETSVLQQCMDDAAKSVLGETATLKEKNAALEHRLAALVNEHQELKQRSDEERKELVRRGDEERKELLALQAKLGDHLGAAAKKVQPPAAPAIATATANSEGRSRTEAAPQSQPAALASGPVTATATLVPANGTVPAACLVPPEAGAERAATTSERGRSPSRQARTPRREGSTPVAATKVDLPAKRDLPACDPTKTPGVQESPAPAGEVAEDVKPAVPSVPVVGGMKSAASTAAQ